MRDKHFKREAEGIEVCIWEGWPRSVDITNVKHHQKPKIFMSLEQAEGLLYALGAAVRDAQAHDRRMEA